jgi:hypothetical protein
MTGYQSKKAAASAKTIDEVNWADHEPDGRRVAAQDKLAQPAQEPVAWMNKHGDCKSAVFREAEAGAKEEYNIPLYTNQTLEKNS